MINIQNMQCYYDKTRIIENLHLSLPSHLTIIGNNGSGKSTLAKALCALIDYEGSITIEGKELRDMSRKERAKYVNYIPSKLESFDTFTTLKEFLLLARYAHNNLFEGTKTSDKHLVQETLEFLHITHLQDKFLQELSSGEQQLTLIAAALIQESRIIIFDEPTANLDPQNSVAFYKILKNLQKSHQTILITHDLALAAQFSNALLYMQKQQHYFFDSSTLFFTSENLKKFYNNSIIYKHRIGIHYD